MGEAIDFNGTVLVSNIYKYNFQFNFSPRMPSETRPSFLAEEQVLTGEKEATICEGVNERGSTESMYTRSVLF